MGGLFSPDYPLVPHQKDDGFETRTASYHHWLVLSYMYLWEAHDSKYLDPIMNKCLCKVVNNLSSGGCNSPAPAAARAKAAVAARGARDAGNNNANPPCQCPCCGRTDLHTGMSMGACVIPDGLSNAQGKKLVMACLHLQAEQIIKVYKRITQEHPTKTKKDAAAEAWAEVIT
ncbi:hypothetical protein ACA910_004580 [Epithemia clementina (nom. ined.)]